MKSDPDHLLKKRLMLPIALVLSVSLLGTLGYYRLGHSQGATLLDAFYMTVITLTTLGYREVIELNATGKWFTIFIAITGIGTLFYTWGELIDYFVTRRLADPKGEKKMLQTIQALKGHIIIAGLGRVGKQAALELQEAGSSFVVVDPTEAAKNYAEERRFLFLHGDATDDAILERAGISHAAGLIVTTGSDASNLYIVLSARALNSQLFIAARVVEENSTAKLLRAGANRAISPHAIGGKRLAHILLSPTVVDFFDTALKRGEENLSIEDIRVQPTSQAIGESMRSLQVRDRSGASVLVVFRGNQIFPNPSADLLIEGDDRLLALGTQKQLEMLEKLIE